MPTAPARAASRSVFESRCTTVTFAEPIIELEHAGPDRPPYRYAIESATIRAIRRRGDTGPRTPAQIDTIARLLIDGEPRGPVVRREYYPDHMIDQRYHHADMPTALAQFVHDEITEADEPCKSTVTIRWDDDEHVTVLLDGAEVASVNHDAHGWDGMRAVLDAAEKLATLLNAEIVTLGVPNL